MRLRGCAPSWCAMNSGSVSRVNPTECTARRTNAQTRHRHAHAGRPAQFFRTRTPCTSSPPHPEQRWTRAPDLRTRTPCTYSPPHPERSSAGHARRVFVQDPMHLFATTPAAARGTRAEFSHQDPMHLFAATPGAALGTRAGFSHQDPMHLFAATPGAALGMRAEFSHQDPMHQFEAAPATRILRQPRPLAPIPSRALPAEVMHREPARVRLRRHTGGCRHLGCLPGHRLPGHCLSRPTAFPTTAFPATACPAIDNVNRVPQSQREPGIPIF